MIKVRQLHYYAHHIGDLLKDTSHLSNEQLAVYLKLLWKYYLDEKPLDNDLEMLAFAMRSDEKTVLILLKHYFKLDGEVWRQTRCDKEIATYHSKSEKAINSANARWNKANAMRTHTDRNANERKNDANQEPITNNHKPIVEKTTTRGARLSIHFEPDFDFAKQNGIANPSEELAKFRDYWNSQAGAKGVKLDWQATWRNWCRNAKKPTVSAFAPPSPAITTPSREAVDPLMSQAVQESMRTLKPVSEIHARLKRERMNA